jgi:hypothetical protein
MEPFMHIPNCPFVICKRCKIGLVANEVGKHIAKRHGDISRQQARSIRQAAKEWLGIAYDQAGLRQWAWPAPDKEAVPHIEAPVEDGLGC